MGCEYKILDLEDLVLRRKECEKVNFLYLQHVEMIVFETVALNKI